MEKTFLFYAAPGDCSVGVARPERAPWRAVLRMAKRTQAYCTAHHQIPLKMPCTGCSPATAAHTSPPVTPAARNPYTDGRQYGFTPRRWSRASGTQAAR